VLASATCFNNIGDGSIKWLFLKEKEKLWSQPSLINRSMNRYKCSLQGAFAHAKNGDKIF
jgi:hypothetical protein